MKAKNLIWIIVDSVRTYRSHEDDRDRLDIMDEFASESIEFLNAYTSAPSSILSGAAMFTGMPSCFISRHFDFWQFDPKVVVSLQNVLIEKGYTNYAIHNSKEDREVMRDLIHPIQKKFFPKGVTHGKWWTNRQVNQILENAFKIGIQTPSFFMLWYDCRNDPNTSEIVKQGLQIFKDNGLYDDSVIIMCSDHGYPDPRSGLDKNMLRKTRHDMVVTDDNVKIPLFIKYPGCKPHKIDKIIGTVDLFPTTLSLLGAEYNDHRMKNVKGYNLIELMEGNVSSWEDRTLRIDTRLRLAPGRVTALRNDIYKYVYYHDEKKESLYDLKNDTFETVDLFENPSDEVHILKEKYKQIFKELQDEMNSFHINELQTAFAENIGKAIGKKVNNIIMLSVVPYIFMHLISHSLKSVFENLSLDILISPKQMIDDKTKALFDRVIVSDAHDLIGVKKSLKNEGLKRYDFALIINETSSVGFDDPVLYKIGKKLSKKVIMVDFNMKFYSRFLNLWTRPLRRYLHNWVFYKQEPLLIFRDIFYYAKMIFNYFLHKKLVHTPDMEKVKKMRDRALLAQRN